MIFCLSYISRFKLEGSRGSKGMSMSYNQNNIKIKVIIEQQKDPVVNKKLQGKNYK